MKKFMFIFLLVFLTACSKSEVKEIVYECEEGYQLNDNMCIKTVETLPAKINYECPVGYQLSGTICIKNEYINVDLVKTCPTGTSLVMKDGKEKCYKVTSIPMKIKNYWCMNNDILSGTNCISREYANPKLDYMCYGNEYYDSQNGWCQLVAASKFCPSGYNPIRYNNNSYVKCVRTPTPSYSCPDGYKSSNGKCVKEIITKAYYTEGCDSDYIINLDEKACKKYEYLEPNVTKTCKSGYTLNGNVCERIVSTNATSSYYCDTGYVHIGNSCVKYDQKEAIKK